MIEHYIDSIRLALSGLLDLATQWAFPLSLSLGLLLSAGVLMLVFGRQHIESKFLNGSAYVGNILGALGVGLVLIVGWAALRTTKPLAQEDIHWRDTVEATSNPVPDAPPVSQAGPAVAVLVQHTYTRSLTLPPSFLSRIGGEGVNVLAPYLTDPTSENVVRLRDSFRRNGRNAIFTRESTVEEESSIPFSNSQVKVSFHRLGKRAYDATFEGHYSFKNTSTDPAQIHFLFNLPQAGTIRDLQVKVGKDTAQESGDEDTYEWKGELAPNEEREAVVTYHVIGARVWSYVLGSTRRRVDQFQLEAQTDGDVTFSRGSLQPSTIQGRDLTWQLSNVVTGQQLAIVFPPDNLMDKLYLQALSALPAAFFLFFVGIVAYKLWHKESLEPTPLGLALVAFGFGLGAATVAYIYLIPLAALTIAPLCGALVAAAILGKRSLLISIPVALIPATFLSEQNTGLLIVVLTALTVVALVFDARKREVMIPQTT